MPVDAPGMEMGGKNPDKRWGLLETAKNVFAGYR